MGRIRRGGFIFLFRLADHPPRHVHVYKDGRLVVKWDLQHQKALTGSATRQILEYILELRREGKL